MATLLTKEAVLKEYRVRELMEAARRVIGRHGFEGTTIDRVAEEAHVAKGTIYLYFSNKEDLLHAAVFQGLRAMIAETLREDREDLPPLERLRALVMTQFRIQSSNQDFLKAFFLESKFVTFEPGDERGEALRSVYGDYLDFVASVLQSAIDAGVFRPIDPRFAAFMLSEMLTGCLRRRLLGLVSTPLEDDANEILDLFLRGIIAAPCA
ncbi:MAG: TetR/AcrR family transcriptional regulator [Candidatus Binataceae bacterium]